MLLLYTSARPGMSKFLYLIHFVGVIARIALVTCADKTWTSSSELNSARNWDAGRLPCAHDEIVFENNFTLTHIHSSLPARKIVLPTNGVFILDDDAQIVAEDTTDQQSGCPGQVLRYRRSAASQSWFDPLSWCAADNLFTPSPSDSTATVGDNTAAAKCSEAAVLPVEALPCTYDKAVFPELGSFSVQLPASHPNIRVSGLQIGRLSYDNYMLRELQKTTLGRLAFQSSTQESAIEILQQKCTDPTGCLCHNQAVKEAVCGIEGKRCKEPRCSSTVIPEGACCPQCGELLMATLLPGFDFVYFKTSLEHRFKAPNVALVTSRVQKGVQVFVFSPTDDNSAALKTGKAIAEYLRQEADGLRVKLEKSEASKQKAGTRSRTSLVIVIPVIIGLLVLITLVTVFFLHRRGRTPSWTKPTWLRTPVDLTSVLGVFKASKPATDDSRALPMSQLKSTVSATALENPYYGVVDVGEPISFQSNEDWAHRPDANLVGDRFLLSKAEAASLKEDAIVTATAEKGLSLAQSTKSATQPKVSKRDLTAQPSIEQMSGLPGDGTVMDVHREEMVLKLSDLPRVGLENPGYMQKLPPATAVESVDANRNTILGAATRAAAKGEIEFANPLYSMITDVEEI